MENNIIVIKQLPVIEEQLHKIKAEVQKSVEEALQLEVNEDTYKSVKKVKADLKKDFQEFETKRKEVKQKIIAPYEAFDKVYKECVSELYKSADSKLDEKIKSVEGGIKSQKDKKIRSYYCEYAESIGVDILPYEDSGIKVDMSTSEKKLKESAKDILDGIKQDLECINTQPDKEEILVEYKKSFDLTNALMTVSERHKAIELEKQNNIVEFPVQEEPIQETGIIDKPLQAPTQVEAVEEVQEPKETTSEEKMFTLKFTVHGTMAQLKDLKQFIIERGIRYE